MSITDRSFKTCNLVNGRLADQRRRSKWLVVQELPKRFPDSFALVDVGTVKCFNFHKDSDGSKQRKDVERILVELRTGMRETRCQCLHDQVVTSEPIEALTDGRSGCFWINVALNFKFLIVAFCCSGSADRVWHDSTRRARSAENFVLCGV